MRKACILKIAGIDKNFLIRPEIRLRAGSVSYESIEEYLKNIVRYLAQQLGGSIELLPVEAGEKYIELKVWEIEDNENIPIRWDVAKKISQGQALIMFARPDGICIGIKKRSIDAQEIDENVRKNLIVFFLMY